MELDPNNSPQHPPSPQRLRLDNLTAYIYRHFHHLLTDQERAAERVLFAQSTQHTSRFRPEAKLAEFFRLPEIAATFPDLIRRIDEHGVAQVMRAAADRVLRDNPGVSILHECKRCGALCRTPTARQCFECGFNWHNAAPDARA